MRYGLIGEKLGHSFSPIIHRELGNPLYELKEVSKEEIGNFLKEADFTGINVTIPYKQTVMDFCKVEETAEQIGSVNTVVKREEKLFGYNTDYLGFAYMVQRAEISLEGKRVLILGSGGTSKTACFVAKQAKAAQIIILSRNPKNAGTEKTIKTDSYSNLANYSDAEILINTTPVGMYPKNEMRPVEWKGFECLEAVLDVIYNPLRTMLLMDAATQKLRYSNGLPMLVAQAWYANRIFFNKDIILTEEDNKELESIIEKVESLFQNDVLIGMPGSGKSTIGQLLATKRGREYFDSDMVFTNRYQMCPGKYIENYGEDAFREKESEVISEIAKKTGVVISTGGGSILRKENREALLQNGRVVFVKRNLEMLEMQNRPLSKDLVSLEKMYKERLPLYQQMADQIVDNDESPEKCVEEVLAWIKKDKMVIPQM